MKTIDCLQVLQALPEGLAISGYRLRKWDADDYEHFPEPIPVTHEIERLKRHPNVDWELDQEEGGKVAGLSLDFAEQTVLLHLDATPVEQATSGLKGPHLREKSHVRPVRP